MQCVVGSAVEVRDLFSFALLMKLVSNFSFNSSEYNTYMSTTSVLSTSICM